jgi:hypothetical protein
VALLIEDNDEVGDFPVDDMPDCVDRAYVTSELLDLACSLLDI